MKSSRLPSRRRAAGMTLLELTVCILVLLGLISVTFVGARSWKKGSDRAGCIMTLRKVQQAVRGYQNNHQLLDGAPLDIEGELVGPGKMMENSPRCPAGGTYTLGSTIPLPGTMAVTCSLAGPETHVTDASMDW